MIGPRILVIGAGSIGSRHARNLVARGATVEVMDPDHSRSGSIEGASPRAFDLEQIAGYDGIVIASPTSEHRAHLHAALGSDARVMVEKPFSLTGDDVDALVALAGDRVMVGYNLRLHEPLERVDHLVSIGAIGRPVAGRLWFGSWLPDWRPAIDYRTTYSAQRTLGGGVLFDAIHELDEAIWFFGHDLDVLSAFVARIGPLDIDVEDTVKALLIAGGDIPVELSLDYLSRTYRRGVELIGTDASVRFDWSTCDLVLESGPHRQVEHITTSVDRSYEREAQRFLEFITDATPPPVDASIGAASVRLASRILEVAKWT